MTEIEITRKINVDKCLVDEIKNLNNLGIITLSCCCGHGKEEGWIAVHDDTYQFWKNLCDDLDAKIVFQIALYI